MASIQSVSNVAAPNLSLPPNLTQQHVQEVYQVGHQSMLVVVQLASLSKYRMDFRRLRANLYPEIPADARARRAP